MALVMLPCDLPWWPTITTHLTHIASCRNSKELVEYMQRIHSLCNVGLDPDEDTADLEVFQGFTYFLNSELTQEERDHFFNSTLPCLAHRALDLKRLRPPNGLHFSLQQQSDNVQFDRDFLASLLAHCFFSTFPKRTIKTHPTLQDFNFTYFFRFLHLNYQKCKFLSFLQYFNFLEKYTQQNKITLSRQVMHSSKWLTLEDWLQCKLPLCPLLIKRNGNINKVGPDHFIMCSSSNRIGGSVLSDGNTMECIQVATCPELLVILLFVESLEDNEVIVAEGVFQISRINDPKGKCDLEIISNPQMLTICCIDPDDYSNYPKLQYQQDSILRELNKALLGFRQKTHSNGFIPRRLSPIGESFCSTPDNDNETTKPKENSKQLKIRKFIVLGSSGECLPITRGTINSMYSSCQSNSTDDYHSARTSFTEDDDHCSHRFSCSQSNDRKSNFADRLKEALDRAEIATSESDDLESKFSREGSCGFVLDGESQPKSFEEIPKKHYSPSSKYSFTTDFTSELEMVYEQLGRWLDEENSIPNEIDNKAVRDKAVKQFAGNLLKRTLSESFVGVPVTDGFSEDEIPARSVKLAARSLSLELARHRNKLAAQLVSVVLNHNEDVMPLATYNWGCSSKKGDPQLKLLIQWLASSVALLPHILYFTAANLELNKLDTVCRVLLDRQWSVGELIGAVLKYSENKIFNPDADSVSIFEQIIGMEDKTYPYEDISPD